MGLHQRRHIPQGRSVTAQSGQGFRRNTCADGAVAVAVSLPRRVHSKTGWFPHVMKEHGQPQHRVRCNVLHCPYRVFPHIAAVVAVALIKTKGGAQLRQTLCKDVPMLQQQRPDKTTAEKAF